MKEIEDVYYHHFLTGAEESPWSMVSPRTKRLIYHRAQIMARFPIVDLPVVPGINSFKLLGIDVIPHPLIADDTVVFYDKSGRAVSAFQKQGDQYVPIDVQRIRVARPAHHRELRRRSVLDLLRCLWETRG